MSRGRAGTAFTLVELLVYFAVLLVFTTGLYAAFNLAVRSYYMGQARSDALQGAQVACDLIGRLSATASNQTLLTQTTTPTAFMFCSAQPAGVVFQTDGSGNLLYQKWVCFYWDKTNSLLKESEQALASPTAISAGWTSVGPPAAPSFATMTGLPSRVVARNVINLLVPPTTPANNYQINVQAVASVANGQPTGLTVTGQFTMRNN